MTENFCRFPANPTQITENLSITSLRNCFLQVNGMAESSNPSTAGPSAAKKRRIPIRDSQRKVLRGWYNDNSNEQQSLESCDHWWKVNSSSCNPNPKTHEEQHKSGDPALTKALRKHKRKL